MAVHSYAAEVRPTEYVLSLTDFFQRRLSFWRIETLRSIFRNLK